jgi:hypothetical protein
MIEIIELIFWVICLIILSYGLWDVFYNDKKINEKYW